MLGLLGMKGAMERNILNDGFRREPAGIPGSMAKRFRVEVREVDGRKVWTLSPKDGAGEAVILFLHGGAYHANITKMHWRFIGQILARTKAEAIVPDYPLAPGSTCADACRFLDKVYASLVSDHPGKAVVLMGDSAGGGLALGLAMKIREEGLKQPEQIILFCPWLDASMTNAGLPQLARRDKILSIQGLKIAGKKYAGDLPLTDYRLSPIYGDLYGLGRVTVFTGTHEILLADARTLKQRLERQQADFSYHEYPGMFHDWMLVPGLPESGDVIVKVVQSLFPGKG
jgi:acetyl esterase/lipase